MEFIKEHRKSFILIAFGILALIAALIVGISDNPPGIILLFISSILLVLAFTYNLKTTKSYLILLASSIIGFVLFAVLHNILEHFVDGTPWGFVAAFFFLVALFICPAGTLVGIVGTIVNLIKGRRATAG